MKIATLCIILLLAGTQSASAQTGAFERFEVSGAFGASFPLGAFNDSSSVGFQYGGAAGVYLSPRSAVGVTYDRFHNSASDDYRANRTLSADQDAKFTSWQIALYYKQMLMYSDVNPYVRLQVGLLDIDTTIDGEKVEGLNADFSMTGGLGLQVRGRRRISGFAEFLFTRVIVDERNPEEESDLRNFLSLRGGVLYLMGGVR